MAIWPIGHTALIADSARTGAYQRAISETVKDGDVVVDLGTGTGILAFFACQAGAKKVYAIEKQEIIEVAREIARVNNLEKRIAFIRDVSTEVTLPEKADVLLSELIGNFVYSENLIHFVLDARDRFLKKDGALIPSSINLFIVPVEAPKIYDEVAFYNQNLYGIDFLPAHKVNINSPHQCQIETESFLSRPAPIKQIDFNKIREPYELYLDKTVSFVVDRPGILHGLAGWFDIHLSKNVLLSTSLALPVTHWESTFFPVEKPTKVAMGDTVKAGVTAAPWQGDIAYSWNVEVGKVRFSHSTVQTSLLSAEDLLSRSVDFAPSLSGGGEVVFFILSRCNGKNTIQKIARELCEQYPETYNNLRKALIKVGKTVKKFSSHGKV
jgi:protein arginine N-methyltransferase 1